MPSRAAQSVESDVGDHDWSSLAISVFKGRNGGLNENISKLRHGHGPNAFELLKLALSTLFASFCKTFRIAIVLNLLSVTEVVSYQRLSNINLACVRLNENTSGPELLARFVKWLFVQSENNHLNVVISAQLTLREMVMARIIFNGKATSVALPHLVGSPEVQVLHVWPQGAAHRGVPLPYSRATCVVVGHLCALGLHAGGPWLPRGNDPDGSR